MASKVITASKSMYVDNSKPTQSLVTDYLEVRDNALIPYIYFDVSEVPKYANCTLRIYAHKAGYLKDVYSLNSPFAEGVTNFNNRPGRTLVKSLDKYDYAYNSYCEMELTGAQVATFVHGISISARYDSLFRSHRVATGKPNILCEWKEEESTKIKATVTNTSIDEGVTISWNAIENQIGAKVSAYSNGVLVAFKEIYTADTSLTFDVGSIKTTNVSFNVEVWVQGIVYTQAIEETTLTRVEPIIISLEPDNVNQNISNQINISWVVQNQQSYTLTLGDRTYSGTTGSSILLPSNTLTSGTKTMTLTITYTSAWGDVRTATKTVTFLAYGNPPNPILGGTAIYNSALPTFTWTATEQVGYELKLRNSDGQDIISTGEVISTDKQYTSTVALDNNRNYTLLVRVKNQYNLWSAWVSKVITTAFVVPNTPTIEIVTTNNASIIVSLNIKYSSEFSKAEIWRKTDNSDWIRIAYNLDNTFSYEDGFIGNEVYYYKVRAIGISGGIAESETLSAKLGKLASIKNFHFTNIEKFSQSVELSGNPTVRLVNNRKIVSTVFAGCKAPKLDRGEEKYRTVSFSFSIKEDAYEQLLEVADNSQVLLYRDGRGRKFYCQVNSYPKIVYASGGYLTISFSIIEVEFVEGDFYSGSGNQPSLFFDGTWYFDGTVELDGEV